MPSLTYLDYPLTRPPEVWPGRHGDEDEAKEWAITLGLPNELNWADVRSRLVLVID
jgi:hypothetical protein